jgi:hypothetical protein
MSYLSTSPGPFSAGGGVSNFFKGANVASGSTIVPTGNLFHVTGTATIAAITATELPAGTEITMVFDAAATVQSGASLVLAGGVNFVAAAGNVLALTYDGSIWREKSRNNNLLESQHEALRQLIHFIDEGPTTGLVLRKAITGTVFPTAVTWYHTPVATEYKLIEKLLTWTGPKPTTIVWKIYSDTEVLLATVTDTISYTGVFETGRTRVVS